MYQHSSNSANVVHRGRQQKRIIRQPLQSSSSSAAAAAAAVAETGAEAAWRGFDLVPERRWQTIERWLQLGRRCLATNWWLDEWDVLGAETSNEGHFHYRQDVVVAGGLVFTCLGSAGDEQGNETQVYRIVRKRHAQVWEYAVGEIEMMIWMVGLDAAGETAVSWELKQDEAGFQP